MKIKHIFIILLITNIILADESIRIIPPQSKFDSSHNYFYTLLKKILAPSNKEQSNINILFSKKMEQGRALLQLKNNDNIDIYWAGSSINREKELRAIKIPLLKGLLGYRVFIIKKKDRYLFDKITNIEELKKLTACQGTHWPDTKILENSNFNLIKNTNYESMFLQVNSNRCSYFPRGIHEAYSEIDARKTSYSELILYDKLILYYPFPMYFFVSKENEKLALKIETRLLEMIENGNFNKHLKESTITKHLFPMKNWNNKKIFKISNPLLSTSTNINDEKFWILPNIDTPK